MDQISPQIKLREFANWKNKFLISLIPLRGLFCDIFYCKKTRAWRDGTESASQIVVYYNDYFISKKNKCWDLQFIKYHFWAPLFPKMALRTFYFKRRVNISEQELLAPSFGERPNFVYGLSVTLVKIWIDRNYCRNRICYSEQISQGCLNFLTLIIFYFTFPGGSCQHQWQEIRL